MKNLIFVILLIIPTVAFASENNRRFYIGMHGNMSWSRVYDGNSWIIGNLLGMNEIDGFFGQGVQRIDNGDMQSSPSFSITAGVEKRLNYWDSKNMQLLIGCELFFDNINKTIIQGDQTWIMRSFTIHRGNTDQPIHKTNFLVGLRGKLGVSLYDRFDIYGHAGLTYWNRKYYLREDKDAPYWGSFEGLQTLPVLPFVGIGTTFHITNNWAINASYMMMMPALYDVHLNENSQSYNFANSRVSAGLNIFTLGILYYF